MYPKEKYDYTLQIRLTLCNKWYQDWKREPHDQFKVKKCLQYFGVTRGYVQAVEEYTLYNKDYKENEKYYHLDKTLGDMIQNVFLEKEMFPCDSLVELMKKYGI